MLSVEKLTYHYKGRPAVLKDVNFNVHTGEFLAILGNNGVGKSTMLKCFNIQICYTSNNLRHRHSYTTR